MVSSSCRAGKRRSAVDAWAFLLQWERSAVHDEAEGVRWGHLAAEQGHADAQFALGNAFSNGSGVLKDDVEAVRWYRSAAEQGHAYAQVALGNAFSDGSGVLKDGVEAVRWYRLAAEQGINAAQMMLGAIYINGKGVLKDYVLAHMWLNIASANGLDEAKKFRDDIESELTSEQILRATELARACMTSDYKNLRTVSNA